MEEVSDERDWFLLSNSAKCRLVRPREIAIFQVSGNYVTVTFIDGSTICFRGSLEKHERDLDWTRFFQTGRNTIVNLEAIKEVSYFDKTRLAFKMVNDKEIILSRHQSRKLKRQFAP